eukprot:TRINITY_DN7031_c0_g1_i2.p1 TRINITY_DN7031_c0_g1~~TRINITY_DN7031_c0_g1_i2.p1  ORF type:complete len:173 (-),score=17.64 TRINITY_DN7031_c0_g1_i2:253-771(-)
MCIRDRSKHNNRSFMRAERDATDDENTKKNNSMIHTRPYVVGDLMGGEGAKTTNLTNALSGESSTKRIDYTPLRGRRTQGLKPVSKIAFVDPSTTNETILTHALASYIRTGPLLKFKHESNKTIADGKGGFLKKPSGDGGSSLIQKESTIQNVASLIQRQKRSPLSRLAEEI